MRITPGVEARLRRQADAGGEGTRYRPDVRWKRVAIDVAVTAFAFALSTVALAAGEHPADARQPDALAYLLVAACSATPLLRRRAPLGATVAGFLVGIAFGAADYPRALTPVVLLSISSGAFALPRRRARLLLAAALVLGAVQATLGAGPTDPSILALVVAAWLLGRYVRSRRDHEAELEQKNRLLVQAQADLAERAVSEERLRIARELHDVVAHTLTVIALHAGTGRMVAEDDPAAARQALATVEAATRSALLEMRRMLGVLRDADGAPGSLAPSPGLDDLGALVADLGRSGLIVDLRIEGERPEVPAGVDLSAYRIVQEALTNVIKHAGADRAAVTVRYGEDAVTVEVDDEGHGPVAGLPPAGGHGLVGMRERVALYDGQLDVGPSPEGGFHVVARLPLAVSS